ncbi:MAG: MBL fold metallo-hydrolase [Sarcina sp.]
MLNKLTEKVYYMDFVQAGDRPVLGVVEGDNYSLIIDSGNSKDHGEELLFYIKELNLKKPKFLLLTHWHWDHIWGLNTMNLINIAHEKTEEKFNWLRKLSFTDEAIRERVLKGEEIEFCEEHIKIEHPSNERKLILPKIDITFKEIINFNLGGVIVKVEHLNVDHSEDSVVITIEEKNGQKTTFLGDGMYMDMYNGPWSYSKEKLYPFLEKLLSYDSDYYIPAHHDKYNKKEFEEFVKYIKIIGNLVDKSTDLEKSIEIIKKEFNRELEDFEIDDIKAFIEGNKKI